MKLDATLRLLHPTAEETALLRACLHAGASARAGWRTWLGRRPVDDPMHGRELSKWRTLLPLLARSAIENNLEVGRDVMTYLRATTAREALRAERLRPIAAMALAVLEGAGVRALVVRGVALAAADYEAWALRHCHDLDLLVSPPLLDRAVSALMSGGFVGPVGPATPRGGAVLEHTSGFRISLHTRPFSMSCHDAGADTFDRSARTIRIEDRIAASPSPEATLVHVLGHATYSPSRRNLRWVSDAWQLVERHGELDWGDVLDRIAEHRLDLPVASLVGYLVRFGMVVPDDVAPRLRERAARADRVAVDVALGGVVAATTGDVRGLWRSARSWRDRFEIARWATVPTPGYLRATSGTGSGWTWPLGYAVRPVRFLIRTTRRRPPHPSARRVRRR